MPYREDLQCTPLHLDYSFERREGNLVIQDDGAQPDVKGCVALFVHIDPAVRQVRTIATDTSGGPHYRELARWKIEPLFDADDASRRH